MPPLALAAACAFAWAAVAALEGVEKTQPKKKKGAGVKRSRVTKSAQGIKVSMPSKKKKK